MGRNKSEAWYEEHVCLLWGLESTNYCKDRLPHHLPSKVCCCDCANEACKRRCLNTKDKCGQALLARKVYADPPPTVLTNILTKED